MKVWYSTGFIGHYPLGTAAVVVARNETEASTLLNETLVLLGLRPTSEPEHFVKLQTGKPQAVVLRDGNY